MASDHTTVRTMSYTNDAHGRYRPDRIVLETGDEFEIPARAKVVRYDAEGRIVGMVESTDPIDCIVVGTGWDREVAAAVVEQFAPALREAIAKMPVPAVEEAIRQDPEVQAAHRAYREAVARVVARMSGGTVERRG